VQCVATSAARYRERMEELRLGPLAYVYAPSADVAADAHWLVEVLGAELVFAIESGGTRVAMVRLGTDAPILVTDHLPDERPVFMYRVDDLESTMASLEARGCTAERTVELPMGPAMTLRAPGGLRLAIFAATRPFVVDSMDGQRDF
jgi:hypothetical protein